MNRKREKMSKLRVAALCSIAVGGWCDTEKGIKEAEVFCQIQQTETSGNIRITLEARNRAYQLCYDLQLRRMHILVPVGKP